MCVIPGVLSVGRRKTGDTAVCDNTAIGYTKITLKTSNTAKKQTIHFTSTYDWGTYAT